MSFTSRRPLARAGVVALLAASVLAGCAQEEPTEDVSPSTSAATSEDAATSTEAAPSTSRPTTDDAATTSAAPLESVTVRAVDKGFEVTLPAGWADASDLVDDKTVQVAGRAPEPVDGFYTNILVTKEEYVSNLTSAVERSAKELAGEDGEFEMLEPAKVDGNTSPGYTIVRKVEGRTLHQTQRWISHDKTLYVVTLSTVGSEARTSAPLLDDVLDSWTWTD
ncbi:hypothetical protein [Ornithinimicrobium tianjinense]|uniref:Lipoprotein LpqN n=1 Tax=Ornithinimicrobium tianjinense TaxID=1195761 RepID=A0A917BWZ0_9MICO|nr:hypothetical protein [Ornithinimicrobium tianjinense]GGF59770.1 hypothetical protein GCM10011366_29510 [Ornithinimicrobium tianjinense]